MSHAKKKIAIVLEATLGGTRKHVFDLIEGLEKAHFDIYFIYSDARADAIFKKDIEQVSLLCCQAIRLPMQQGLMHLSNLKSLVALRKVIKDNKIDILHLHGALAGGIGRLAVILASFKGKVIYTPHGGVFHKLKGWKGQVFKGMERFLAAHTSLYIAVSAAQKKEIVHTLGIDPLTIKVVHNGISLNTPSPAPAVDSLMDGLSAKLANKFIVLYPALFLPAKGHADFFAAFSDKNIALNDDIVVLLAGNGPLEKDIKAMVEGIEKLKDKVLFLGFVNNLSHLFERCNLVILPSKAEAFGYVILEAFLHRKTVFCTKVGGIPDIVKNKENGLLFGQEEMGLLINAINAYQFKPEILTKMGAAGYENMLQEFSVKKMVSRYIEIYNYD